VIIGRAWEAEGVAALLAQCWQSDQHSKQLRCSGSEPNVGLLAVLAAFACAYHCATEKRVRKEERQKEPTNQHSSFIPFFFQSWPTFWDVG
jgi:hypothetical protein